MIDDRIVHISPAGETEIGKPPQGVGLECLRFDGQKIIDLNKLDRIWVVKKTGFELHAISLPGAQLVEMTYDQRDRLVDDNGTYRLKTQGEIDAEKMAQEIAMIKGRLRTRLDGVKEEINHYQLMLILALIVYSRTQNATIADLFDKIINSARDIYPLAKMETNLDAFLLLLKDAMSFYWRDIDNVNSGG